MDRKRFDALTRVFAASTSRRVAVSTLLGAALAGTPVATDARKQQRNARGQDKGKGRRRVSSQASCASPSHGANLNGCDFSNMNLSGDDLSSSSMVGTNFSNSILGSTDLSSSNLRGANFRDGDLCRTDLSSSNLRNADFTNADLTGTTMRSSSGCGTATFTGVTFCQTTMCNGTVRNDHCPANGPVCCGGSCLCGGALCTGGDCCDDGQCVSGGAWNQCGADGATCAACATGEVCAADSDQCESCASQTGLTVCDGFVTINGPTPGAQCGPASRLCACAERAAGGSSVCWTGPIHCNIPGQPCTTPEGACPGNLVCVRKGSCPALEPCEGNTVCVPLCSADGNPDPDGDGKVGFVFPEV